MFACLYSVSVPLASLVAIAEAFTPRFEVIGPLVLLDVSGLSRLMGSPQAIGDELRRTAEGPVRIAIAPTQTAAALLAIGRAGLTVVLDGEQIGALSALQVSLLGELDRLRLAPDTVSAPPPTPPPAASTPPSVGEMWDALPYFESTLDRTSDLAVKAHCGGSCGGGWKHPRDSHAASTTRRAKRSVPISHGTEHPPASAPSESSGAAARSRRSLSGGGQAALKEIQDLLDTLRRWGVKTFAAFAALPAGDVYERLGARGVFWQRVARGEDSTPLVPWVPEVPFDAVLDLEWPIEGLEPLSFVLGRLLEPLAERLERADRGAAVLHTHLRLVSKETHARLLQLPAPMRDPKTLRTLILLDLESNPPSAAIDRVRVLLEPTPARVLQWRLFERAQASPEQVSTLLARLTALMGESHVGSPRLADSWKPGAFSMAPFAIRSEKAKASHEGHEAHEEKTNLRDLRGLRVDSSPPATALRRFRLPVPVRVQVQDGRPVRVTTDRRGVSGGPIVQAAGPWRTSGEWWNDGCQDLAVARQPNGASEGGPQVPQVRQLQAAASCWDRDEWDIAIADGTIYRLYVERDVGQWFLEGVLD